MKMNLILHPGHGKCGSTSIQRFLYEHRAAFEKNGYAVPDRFFHFRFEKNCDFSVALPASGYLSKINKEGSYFSFRKRIETALENARKSGIHTFIVSAENLANLPNEPLHEIFSYYFNVKKVLYYIRRQDEYLLSAWQQWGHKSGKKFDTYCNHQLKTGHPVYTQSAKMLQSHYGKDVLQVAPFSRKAFHNGDLIHDFLFRTGLDSHIPQVTESWAENKSLNPLVCDYLTQLPSIYMSVHDNHPKHNLEKYKFSEPWLFNSGKNYLTETQRMTIIDNFELENRALHSVYFPHISYDSVFGVNTNGQNHAQEQLLRTLEKHQLEFMENWVNKWLRSKNIRSFIISKTKFIRTVKRQLSGSK